MDSTYEIVKELIDFNSEGVDTYNHNGSTWLIFTDQKKWVIELTKEKTLWYNYYFFTGVFKYLSLDVVENQHYITKWVENNVINGVKESRALEEWVNSEKIVDKTIQNGVKDIRHSTFNQQRAVEDTIQNGVKKTYSDKIPHKYDWTDQFTDEIDDIIQNGVKHTEYGDWEDGDERLDDIIKNGVKHTKCVPEKDGDLVSVTEFMKEHNNNSVVKMIDKVIENGVKETSAGGYLGFVEIKGKKIHQFETAKQLWYVEDVIEGGIKKTEVVYCLTNQK